MGILWPRFDRIVSAGSGTLFCWAEPMYRGVFYSELPLLLLAGWQLVGRVFFDWHDGGWFGGLENRLQEQQEIYRATNISGSKRDMMVIETSWARRTRTQIRDCLGWGLGTTTTTWPVAASQPGCGEGKVYYSGPDVLFVMFLLHGRRG